MNRSLACMSNCLSRPVPELTNLCGTPAGEDVVEARGGQVVVVPAGVPHKFVNSGTGRLRQIDIHASERFITEWLED